MIADQRERRIKAFLERLLAIRRQEGLSITEFAREIGASPSLISHLEADRKGKRPSLTFALGAIDRYPELLFFLVPGLPIVDVRAIIGTPEVEEDPES